MTKLFAALAILLVLTTSVGATGTTIKSGGNAKGLMQGGLHPDLSGCAGWLAYWTFDLEDWLLNSGGTCGTDCNLITVTVPHRTMPAFVGPGANRATATNDHILCADTDCEELRLSSGDFTVVATAKKDSTSTNVLAVIGKHVSTVGWALGIQQTNSGLGCGSGCTGVRSWTNNTTTSTINDPDTRYADWLPVAMVFDDGTDEVQLYKRGALGASATRSNPTGDTNQFRILGTVGVGTAQAPAYVDDAGVFAGHLTNDVICQICHCGISGVNCLYSVTGGWLNQGRDDLCDCTMAAPSTTCTTE